MNLKCGYKTEAHLFLMGSTVGKHSKTTPPMANPSVSAFGDRKVRNNGVPFDEAAAERYLDRTDEVFASRVPGMIDFLLADSASRKVT